uniref:Uncharacterized protein n=1 Tax=Meloidogyne javanica TaxID=6303 RepID=A0A915N4T5_MELJA
MQLNIILSFILIILFPKYLQISGMFTPHNRSRLSKTSSSIVTAISKSPQQIKALVTDLNRGCRSGSAMVVKEADEVWNRSEYTISYTELVRDLGEFGKDPYTRKLDEYYNFLHALKRNLTEQLVPKEDGVVEVLKNMVEDYKSDERRLIEMERNINDIKIKIEKELYYLLENDEFMISKEENEYIEDLISDYIHERTVYREEAEPLSSKYDKSFKKWLKEKRKLLVEVEKCYLDNNTIHELGQIDSLRKHYEEKITQAKKLIRRCIESNEGRITSSLENDSTEERSLMQRIAAQLGKLSNEVYLNLAKNIPTRKIRKNLRGCAYADYKWRDIIEFKKSVEKIRSEAEEVSIDANRVISGYSRMLSLLKMFRLEKEDTALRLSYGDDGASSSEIKADKG